MTNLVFEAFWRDHGAQKGLQGLGKQAESAHGSFGKFSVGARKGMLAVGGAAATLGGAGALALGAVGAAGLAMGVKVASGNEQAKISFTTMLGSAKKADSFLRDLQKFAASTPFEFPELQTAASSLISAGINANKVIPIMRTLGDVTSGMGTGSEGVQRATIALQQMSAAGRITGEDLNQLRDAGIPVFDLLSKATGKSKAEIVKLAQAGKLGKDELDKMMKALETGKGLERFSGLMDKQSKSLAGMASTLKDTLGQGLANAVAPSFPLMKQGLEGVSNAAATFFGFLSKNRGSIATIFGSAGETLKTMGKIASAVFGSFAESASGGKNSFKTFADFLATHQEDITRGLVTGAKAALGLGKSIATGASAGLRSLATLSDASTDMSTVMLAGFSAILHGMAETWGFIPGIGPKLKAADKSFASFSKSAVSGMKKIGPGARAAADMIDKNVVPAINKAQGSLDKIGKTEIAKARLRDSAAKAALAIKNIGTTSDGAQIKLKHFNDVSKLGATQQTALKTRLSDAKNALRAQIRTMQDADVSQGKLTAAWKKGKDRLYDEFRQMGLSREEARKLARQYAGIQPKVKTSISQPGMDSSRNKASDYRGKIRNIPTRWNTTASLTFKNNAGHVVANLNKSFQLVKGGPRMSFDTGGVLPGFSPGRDVHRFHSATGGVLDLSGGEAIMRPEWTKRVGGPKAVARMNKAAQSGQAFAGGGVYGAGQRATSREGSSGSQMYGWAVKKKIEGAMDYAKKHGGGADGLGDPAHVANPRGVTGYHGGRFTRLFVANLKAAERSVGNAYSIYQGGFRPTTSYSGSTHNMDAIDAHVNYSLLRAFRKHVGAMGDRTGLGNWASHMHGVPAPGHGYGSPSARAQYRDYIRRGGARQGMRSPWGLAGGGVMVDPSTVNVAEKGPERILPARETVAFERISHALKASGGATQIHITVNAPHYVGPQSDLVKAIEQAEKTGALDHVKRRFAR